MENNSSSKPKLFLAPVIIMLVLGILLFLPAGTLYYKAGWCLWFEFTLITFFITLYFSKKSPDLLTRRMKVKEKKETKKPPAIFNLCFLCYVVPGFDYRFHWSTMPVWIMIISNILVVFGYLFIFLVFKENSYASTIIQVEKEQQVISTGPYAVIRHPMYFGIILMILFTPFDLGSFWALVPALLCIPLNVFRIRGEEEVLLKSLPGYEEYCHKIRYRLIPFIW